MTKKTTSQNVAGEFVRYPLIHRLAFEYAQKGYRGSSYGWRVAKRLRNPKIGRNTKLPSGFVLKVNERDWISKTIYEGTYERALLKFLKSLDLDEFVIDIGANIGVTLWHSLAHNPSKTTFLAFEPSVGCQEALELVCSELSAKGEVSFTAIGSAHGKMPLHGVGNQSHSGSASLLLHSGLKGGEVEVEVSTLDSVMEARGLSRVSLLKIDTEGFESEVIKGGETTLKSQLVDTVVMEVSPNFGPIGFLSDLEDILGNDYIWFRLDEIGITKRFPVLKIISCKDALRYTDQWNLVLMRNEVFTKYKEKSNAITIDAKN